MTHTALLQDSQAAVQRPATWTPTPQPRQHLSSVASSVALQLQPKISASHEQHFSSTLAPEHAAVGHLSSQFQTPASEDFNFMGPRACWCDTLGAGPEMSSNARKHKGGKTTTVAGDLHLTASLHESGGAPPGSIRTCCMKAPPIARSGDAGAAKPSCPNLHVHRPPASENDFLLLQASLEGSSARASITSPPVIQMRGISATSLACKDCSHACLLRQPPGTPVTRASPVWRRRFPPLPRPPSAPVPPRARWEKCRGRIRVLVVDYEARESALCTRPVGTRDGWERVQDGHRRVGRARGGYRRRMKNAPPPPRRGYWPSGTARTRAFTNSLLNVGGSEEVAHNDQSVVEPDTDGHSAHRCGRTKSAQDRRRVGWGSGRAGSNASPAATCTNVRVRALLRSSLDTDTTLALRVHAGARAPRCSSSSGAWAGSARVMSILGAGLGDSRAPRASRLPTPSYSSPRSAPVPHVRPLCRLAPHELRAATRRPPRTRTVAASLRPTSHDARSRRRRRAARKAGIPFDSAASVLAARGLRGSGRGFEERAFGEGGRRAVFLVGPAAHALVEVGYFGCDKCWDHIRAVREARDSGALWCWSTIMSVLGRRQGDVAQQAKKGPVNARRWDAPGAAVRPSLARLRPMSPSHIDTTFLGVIFCLHQASSPTARCPPLFGWPSTARPAESGHAQLESRETASGETGGQNDCSACRRDAVLFGEGRALFSSVPAGPALMEAGSFVCQVSQESMDGGLEATGRSSPGMWFVLRGTLTMLSPTRAASVGRRHLSRGSDVLHLVPTRQCWCPTLADGGVAWVVRRLLARRGVSTASERRRSSPVECFWGGWGGERDGLLEVARDGNDRTPEDA
ncbi:hypothetical protein B0H10DRAFT_1944849 [Mycena sp. CBHHK59/15]|nr:hypothetical protein B0H10DRAFT_1944849 [Mycena sp. CBHHK59/15]